ncbi:AAA family ATPase [Chitinibacter sp. FCG-7]|uniref:AAA family ATPase n=1 Tax=Chitinibacter mangrovi TaxID=3153927 RepID=A0AAU7FCN4_9NEIS
MKLLKLQLASFRCFEKFQIEFDPQLTVLVASNGAGKTSVLDAIAIALGPYVGAFDEGAGRHLSPTDILLRRVRITDSNEMEYAPLGVKLSAVGQFPDVLLEHLGEEDPTDPLHSWSRSLPGPKKTRNSVKDAKKLVDYGKWQQLKVREGVETVLPVLAYYGTGRLWQQKKLTLGKLPKTSRTIGYSDCLDPASSYKSLVEWFRYWNMNALNERLKATQAGVAYTPSEFDAYISSVENAVNLCLAPSGWKNLNYSFRQEELVAEHDQYGELPVEQLSDGIRNMIGMVADIAFRATKLNPQLGNQAAISSPGIVLIDEVDMHLHPEWQQVVLLGLTTAFPNIQFIVTTHSPQVLSTVDNSCIRLLRQRVEDGATLTEVIAPPLQTKGVASADVLATIMGIDPVPNVPEAQALSSYKQLIETDQLSDNPEAEQLRTSLLAHFGASHPVMLDCERLIRLQSIKKRLPPALSSVRE